MPTKSSKPPWEHLKEHARTYIIGVSVVFVGGLLTLGGTAMFDQAHEPFLVAEEHKTDHKEFIDVYQATEAQKRVDAVRRELRKTRSDLRRAQAYLNADPDSPLVNARQAAVSELEDEIDTLQEEYELAKKNLND